MAVPVEIDNGNFVYQFGVTAYQILKCGGWTEEVVICLVARLGQVSKLKRLCRKSCAMAPSAMLAASSSKSKDATLQVSREELRDRRARLECQYNSGVLSDRQKTSATLISKGIRMMEWGQWRFIFWDECTYLAQEIAVTEKQHPLFEQGPGGTLKITQTTVKFM